MRGVPRERRAISHAPVPVDVDAEDAGRPPDDRLELVGLVVVEPGDEPEAVAQRTGDQPVRVVAPTRVNGGNVQPDRAGRGTLAQHDVELEVLHGRVQDLLDGARQAVDLVDEEHVALVELGEDRRQVAGPLERRAGGDVEVHAHLGGDDAGQRGLAEAGRPGEAGCDRPAGRGAWPPRARSTRCSFSSASGRRTRRGASAGGRPRRPARRASTGAGTRNSSRTLSALQRGGAGRRFRSVCPRRPSTAAPGWHVGGSPRARSRVSASASRTSARAEDGADPAGPPSPVATTPSPRGTSSFAFSSMSRRAAVFFPTPGTRQSAATSSSASTRARFTGGCTDKMAMASAGPTPWAPSSASNASRSSLLANP
jgi:hypothetical protein